MIAAMIRRLGQTGETVIGVVPTPVVVAGGVARRAGSQGSRSASAPPPASAGSGRRRGRVSEGELMVAPC